MSPEIWLALIAALSSLVVAIVGLVQGSRLAKVTADMDARIDGLKRAEDRRRDAYERAVAEALPVESAIDEIWKKIQTIREEITAIVDGERIERDSAFEVLFNQIGDLSQHYRDLGGNFDEETRQIAHEAKNAGHSLWVRIVEAQRSLESRDPVDILYTEGGFFAETKLRLGNYQLLLRNRRGSVRQERMEELLTIYKPSTTDIN